MHAGKLAVLALFVPALTQAAEWGIGTEVNDSLTTVYVPIELGEGIRLEPFAAYDTHDIDFGAGNEQAFESVELGAGLFGTTALGEKAQAYFGARASYLHSEAESPFGDTSGNGFALAPAVGGEILLMPQLSVAVEAFVSYRTLDAEGSGTDQHSEFLRTGSRVVARFFFR